MTRYKSIIHRDYLALKIPNDWIFDDSNDDIAIYSEKGVGAITISFLSAMNIKDDIDAFLIKRAMDFSQQTRITIDGSYILNTINPNRGEITANGMTDDWHVYLWVIAKLPRFLVATYRSKKVNKKELTTAKSIISSITYINL
jgi:hypothetical protein